MAEAWIKTLAQLPSELLIIITVSPVRHMKDGLTENSLSKSLLRVLAHEMVKARLQRTHYFPSYEIQIDELRDYRFYAPDMLYPAEQAVDYIWQKLQNSVMTHEPKNRIQQWEKPVNCLYHHPLHPKNPEYKSFLSRLLDDLMQWDVQSLAPEVWMIDERRALFHESVTDRL